jgi:hypothetical protein
MTDYAEKRDFQRMTLESTLEYQIHNEDKLHKGEIKNLSATGVLFVTEQPISLGLKLRITLTPDNKITPPMSADVKVARCDKHSDGAYYLAGEILKIH